MSNVIINNSTYTLTSSIDRPRLKISNSYIPLTTNDNGAKVYIVSNNSKYNVMSYSTSSSSSSTLVTTGYSGISSKASYYYTTSNAQGAMSSITNLTRASTSATLTRASTSATLTRASTSATLTRASTYDTIYGTVAGSGTTYSYLLSITNTNKPSSTQYVTYKHTEHIYATVIEQGAYNSSMTAYRGGTEYNYYTYNSTINVYGNIQYSNGTSFKSNTSPYSYHTYYKNTTINGFTVNGAIIGQPIYTTGTTYLTRQSISGYLTRSSISGYATRSSISGYATRSSISGYAGSLSRQSDYYTSSTAPGAMSNITYLTSSASESASTTTWV